jgi:hypothetical protein
MARMRFCLSSMMGLPLQAGGVVDSRVAVLEDASIERIGREADAETCEKSLKLP